jgi:hypothetical protein
MGPPHGGVEAGVRQIALAFRLGLDPPRVTLGERGYGIHTSDERSPPDRGSALRSAYPRHPERGPAGTVVAIKNANSAFCI